VFGDIGRATSKGEGGFGKASNRAKAKDHRPARGFSVVVGWGALSIEGKKPSQWKAMIGFQSLLQALELIKR